MTRGLVAAAMLAALALAPGSVGLHAQEAAAQTARQTAPAAPGSPSDRVAVPEPTEQALAYHRSGNALWLVDNALSLLIPAAFLFTGLSARIRDWSQSVGRKWFFVIAIYFMVFTVLTTAITLPLTYYETFMREHAYGLSNQTLAKWVSDQATSLVLGLVGGIAFLWVPYLMLAKSPRRWWLYTGLIAVPFIVLIIVIEPIWIDPLFNRFGPMQDKTLETEILQLAERAGIEGGRVFEVAKSEDTKALNAYVNGFGSTKRIVLWDTILKTLDHQQLLVVMGHEMAHYVLGHMQKLILLMSTSILVMLFVVHRSADALIAKYRTRFGFGTLGDVASLPLILLLLNAASLVLTPVILGVQRHYEHEADRFALEITHDNHSAATAFVKMQQENLVVPRPSSLFKWFRSSHPPVGERIDFSNDYRPWETNQPLAYGSLFKNK